MRWLRDPLHRGRVLAVVLLALALVVVGPFLLGADARHLSAWRDGPEDLSRARAEMSAVATGGIEGILATPHALADVEDPGRTLYVAIGVERAYDADEADAVLSFLRRGGRVLLADEGGHGNVLAREAGWAFLSQRVLDSRNHRGDPHLVVVDARAGDAGEERRVLLNSPTALRPLQDASAPHDVLASTSRAEYPNGSYVDLDGNGQVDRSDPVGPFPVLVKARVGEGVLVLASDTGLFMNAQLGLPEHDNGALVRDLARDLLPSGGAVLVDESRHAAPAPLAAWEGALRGAGRATSGPVAPWAALGLLAAGGVLAWRLARPAQDWSRHAHDLGAQVPVPETVRADLARAQRLARRRISERHKIPLEQVATMSAEELVRVTGDKLLSEAAAGTLRADPAPLFSTFAQSSPPSPSSSEAPP